MFSRTLDLLEQIQINYKTLRHHLRPFVNRKGIIVKGLTE